jgi:hypothetical protein
VTSRYGAARRRLRLHHEQRRLNLVVESFSWFVAYLVWFHRSTHDNEVLSRSMPTKIRWGSPCNGLSLSQPTTACLLFVVCRPSLGAAFCLVAARSRFLSARCTPTGGESQTGSTSVHWYRMAVTIWYPTRQSGLLTLHFTVLYMSGWNADRRAVTRGTLQSGVRIVNRRHIRDSSSRRFTIVYGVIRSREINRLTLTVNRRMTFPDDRAAIRHRHHEDGKIAAGRMVQVL